MTEQHQPDEQALQQALNDALMHDLRTALAEEAAQIDPEAGLALLHRRIQTAPKKASLWRRLQGKLAFAPLAITALAGVCIVQSSMLWQAHAPELAGEPLAWRSVQGVAPAGASLRVQFNPGASMVQVSAALVAAQAGIVAGPLSEGSYLLDAADVQAARRSLQSNSMVIEVTEITPSAAP